MIKVNKDKRRKKLRKEQKELEKEKYKIAEAEAIIQQAANPVPVVSQNKLQKRAFRKLNESKLQSFETKFNFIERMPSEIKNYYDTLSFKEKLFTAFMPDTRTGFDIVTQELGYSKTTAFAKLAELKKKCRPVMRWLENEITNFVANQTSVRNIMTREVLIEKLGAMCLPSLADFDDLEEAKARGLMHAVKKMGQKRVKEIDPDTGEWTGEWVFEDCVSELHDPNKPIEHICKMLGFYEPERTNVTHDGLPANNTDNRSVTININPVKSTQEK